MMNIKHIYWRIQSKFHKVCGVLLQWLPVKRNKIVFINFYGKGYGDSPKYIAEEIIGRGISVDIVWLVNDMKMQFPFNVRKVNLLSVRACYELSTARIIISNVKVGLPYKKKCSQYYVQTWHGSVAFKDIEKDAMDKLNPNYVRESIADSKIIDLFLSCNSIQTHEIQNSFWYDGDIFECGSPRNDMLFRDDNVKDSIKQRIGIEANSHVVLYAPTHRDDFRTDVYQLDLEDVRRHLATRFGGQWVMLARLHPNVMGGSPITYSNFVINATAYPDMQELLFIADVLITDYSTTIYDMAIMHKLLLLYAPDLDDYRQNRGLKPLYFDLPSHICQTQVELCNYIDEINTDDYYNRLQRFLDGIRVFDDGHASQRVVDHLLTVINKP